MTCQESAAEFVDHPPPGVDTGALQVGLQTGGFKISGRQKATGRQWTRSITAQQNGK